MTSMLRGSTHPPHYLIHKYWGRKAHNLVASVIEEHTEPGDVVLDPFMGSGVAVIESNKLGRHAVGRDLNPLSALLVEVTTSGVAGDALLAVVERALASVPSEVWNTATTPCRECGAQATLENAVWSDEVLTRVKGTCKTHGKFVAEATEADRELSRTASSLLERDLLTGLISYPDDDLFAFVRRNGRRRIDELFSRRNLLQLAHVFAAFRSIDDEPLRRSAMIVFTSALPNVSAMIPADEDRVLGRSGWQISKFWVPKVRTEKNVESSIRARARVVARGLDDIAPLLTDSSIDVRTHSADDLRDLKTGSVDFVFTDPPYGDSIAYLGLSMFWNAWLGTSVDYESEIVIDPYRRKSLDEYEAGLRRVFNEVARVLKPDARMVLTFNNRHMKYWRALMNALADSGFQLEEVDWQDQAVASGTQGINRANTLRGDFIYTFSNTHTVPVSTHVVSGESLVRAAAQQLLETTTFVTSADLYCAVIPDIIRERAYADDGGRDLDIERVMAEHYSYGPIDAQDFGWRVR
jgi:SAM-dependent methyltransferase